MFKIGDKVRATADKPAGRIGVVDRITPERIGVRFPNFNGHGFGESGWPHPNDAWWMFEDQLEMIEPAWMTSIFTLEEITAYDL